MPATNATFPLSARSMMSPPARGQSRTRLPFSSSTPPTTTLRSVGLSSCSRKKSSTLAPQHPDVPEGPVQFHQILRREGLAPLQDLTPPRVGGTHLLFLLVREVEDVEDEHLVDLGPVEQVAWALGRDLRIVVEDDRGREHSASIPLLTNQHRPCLQVLAPLRRLRKLLRRVHERDEPPTLYSQGRVGRDESLPERTLSVLAAPGGRVGYPGRYPEGPFPHAFGPHLYRPAQRPPAAHQSPRDSACGLRNRLLLAASGDV